MTDPIQSAASPLDTNAQLAALLRAAAVSPLDNIGWLRVTGADRVRWLNGMVTNSISQLADGQGCYNFALNAQGQIQFDLTAFVEPDAILLELSRDQIAQLHEHLDRYIIMDEVEIADVSAQRAGLLLIGPTASDVLHKINLQTPHHTPIRMQTMLHSAAVDEIIHAHSPLVPRYEIWSNPTAIGKLLAELIAAGATPVSAAALDQLRILEGTPRIGTDINDRTLAQETGQTVGSELALRHDRRRAADRQGHVRRSVRPGGRRRHSDWQCRHRSQACSWCQHRRACAGHRLGGR